MVHAGSAGATGSFFHPFSVEKGRSVVNPVTSREGDYLVDRMTDEAVTYIEQQSDRPFLLVVSHYAVHTPLEAPEELTQRYAETLRRGGRGCSPPYPPASGTWRPRPPPSFPRR